MLFIDFIYPTWCESSFVSYAEIVMCFDHMVLPQNVLGMLRHTQFEKL
jgi:hypothetical protein